AAWAIVKSDVPSRAVFQLLEPLEYLRSIWKQVQPSGRIFGDGNGPSIDMIVYPMDGDGKGACELGHRQEAGNVARMRLTTLLKQPLLEANAPYGIRQDGLARRRAIPEGR